jgi:hypothetical protein
MHPRKKLVRELCGVASAPDQGAWAAFLQRFPLPSASWSQGTASRNFSGMQAGDRASQPMLQSLLSIHTFLLLFTLRLGNSKEQKHLPGWRLQQEAKQPRGAAQGKMPGLLGIGVKAWRVGNSWSKGSQPLACPFLHCVWGEKGEGREEAESWRNSQLEPEEGWEGKLQTQGLSSGCGPGSLDCVWRNSLRLCSYTHSFPN